MIARNLETRVPPPEKFPPIEINNKNFFVKSILAYYEEEGVKRHRRAEVRICWKNENNNHFVILAKKEIDKNLEADVQMFAINKFYRFRDTIVVVINGVGDIVFDPFALHVPEKIEQNHTFPDK